jgi:hypothetical protein
VASGDGAPQWKDFESVVYSPFDRAGLHEWLTYFNAQYNAARLRKVLSDAGSTVNWKARLAASPGASEIVEISGDPAAKVMVAGRAISTSRLEVTRSYQVFDLGKGGDVEVVAKSGAVPFLSRVTAGKRPILESGAASSEHVQLPLGPTPAGTLIVPPSYQPPESRIGASGELSDAGTAVYNFRVARPGFYKVWCLVRSSGTGKPYFSYTVDDWNGHGHGMGAPSGKEWQWKGAPYALALGAGEHKLRLKFYQPGIELKQVRVAAVDVLK